MTIKLDSKKKLIVVISFFVFGCRNADVKQYDSLIRQFPTEKNISIKSDIFLTIDSPFKAKKILLTESSLIVRNGGDLGKDSLFYQYDNEGNFKTKFMQQGTSYGTTYAPMSVGVQNDVIWLHDLALEKLVLLDQKGVPYIKKEFQIKNFAYSTQLLDSSNLLTSGFYHSPFLLEVVNLNNGKGSKGLGTFVPPNEKYPANTWKAAYEGFLFLKPDKQKAVLAGRFSTIIKIIDLKKNNQISIAGPKYFEPEFDSKADSSSNNYGIAITKNTRLAFIGGAVSDNYIYLLFSGKKVLEKTSSMKYSNEIFIYDWLGNPIKKLILDNDIINLAVTNDDRTLYTIEKNQGIITKTNNF